MVDGSPDPNNPDDLIHIEREAQINNTVDTAYNHIFNLIWEDAFTGAESRLIWFRLLTLMISAVSMEYEYQIIDHKIQEEKDMRAKLQGETKQ